MDVECGNGEHQPPTKSREPTCKSAEDVHAPAADHVIGPLDRSQQRVEMFGGPGLLGRGDEDQRKGRCFKDTYERHCVALVRFDDQNFGFAAHVPHQR
jgi:hypothetical protein